MRIAPLLIRSLLVVAAVVAPVSAQAPRVGPARGTVIVVGGGAMGPEIYAAFIKAAGGPDALIINVPTASGDVTVGADNASTRAWRNAGARNVVMLHTTNRTVAESDSFANLLGKARGVWFEGGRQFHLVDAYAGTRTEQGFHDVLARGGVVGGSSAGATILGDFLVRGAPSNDNTVMDDPRYEKGFAFLRGVGIDQHVVARERLADLADSIIPKYPKLLGMSEDEGTAWVVTGDTARIIGRDKAFVYGTALHDARKPFLTLYPGDRYDLGARRPIHRAADDAAGLNGFVTGLFAKFSDAGTGRATVLVARDGEVLVDQSFGIADQPKFMPATTVPQFALGALSGVFTALCAALPAPVARANDSTARGRDVPTALQSCISGRLGTPIGLHKTSATADGEVQSDVDELYRMSLGLESGATWPSAAAAGRDAGWQSTLYRGLPIFSAYGTSNGRRAAFLRLPSRGVAIIVLTDQGATDARAIANEILEQLLFDGR